ncbi:hypothetical protein O6H91_14G082300 [Diphasiastrum complanatum]|uniref:Uncharacterized protein n=3 Tax=Diphasiastrum complanatum TaxID=34168 RepID=A0ACC2BRC0_DIPCM|nr:hypothetical protein O6H91_14G082300 [Diphasiastrum complanatum]KAJ7532309.1 hypothetical protein O6H91_14G082300 [Diphasiastrum complanatum]KAJ7532311.1 hypothetical protein O6H91_14G082300 [Diphasiastrum complanatum]
MNSKMGTRKGVTSGDPAPLASVSSLDAHVAPMQPSSDTVAEIKLRGLKDSLSLTNEVEVDLREVYFLVMHFLSSGPCHRATGQLWNELLQHKLLPRRYHTFYSRKGITSGDEDDDGQSFPLSYVQVTERYPNIEKNHLVRLLQQLLLNDRLAPEPSTSTLATAADVPTLLGSGAFSLLHEERLSAWHQPPRLIRQLRWPYWFSDQVHALALRESGGGFARHHRSPSVRTASNVIVKPSVLVDRISIIKKLRGHRNAVYCAIFDRSGQYVITGSDDRLVKIWSSGSGLCLRSCRGHEGDITDLAVSSGNTLVASASNDTSIRVWHLPDGVPVSVLRGHTAGVTAFAFSPRQGCEHHLLSSSEDGTCRIWDARDSSVNSRVYMPKPDMNPTAAKPPASQPIQAGNQILCCAFNADGSIFVTGSFDKLARVWDACKWADELTGRPNYELDILRGHENVVNYVQFSGCSAPSKPFPADANKEECSPRFKNSWFAHDSIVTCSRDGSAIIWTPRPRRHHAKFGRWTKAYHLRVPPPPMPPQPPRGGGPRQRLLPTPRGVNMIVWSLDNRFVLAAIMDCRICVWNAVDGSLVHCLTGHDKQTYVLDVHPYNPRMAMSAGYDGRVIIWDIWEGRPIRTYETGEFNLVDGNFSPDGSSLVVSDEVGQIYLFATGHGDSQKDAKYDQFFLGDFRPLVRDTHGNVLDQETQLPPHQRNLQDLLCDANMIPYPEPYQSTYQQRRLGALGIDWQPPSVHLAVGTFDDAGYVAPAGAGLMVQPTIEATSDQMTGQAAGGSRWVEQPNFADEVVDWDEEVAGYSDDSGSDYNISEESTSEDGEVRSEKSYDDGTEEREDDQNADTDDEKNEDNDDRKNHLRRSQRNKKKEKGVAMDRPSKRKRRENALELIASKRIEARNRAAKRARSTGPKTRASETEQVSRPMRLAARNALNMFSNLNDEEEEDLPISAEKKFVQDNVKIPDVEEAEEGEQISKDLTTNASDLGECSRRPRSQRKLVLKLRHSAQKDHDNDQQLLENHDASVADATVLSGEGPDESEHSSHRAASNQRTKRKIVLTPTGLGKDLEDADAEADEIDTEHLGDQDTVPEDTSLKEETVPIEVRTNWSWKKGKAVKRARGSMPFPQGRTYNDHVEDDSRSSSDRAQSINKDLEIADQLQVSNSADSVPQIDHHNEANMQMTKMCNGKELRQKATFMPLDGKITKDNSVSEEDDSRDVRALVSKVEEIEDVEQAENLMLETSKEMCLGTEGLEATTEVIEGTLECHRAKPQASPVEKRRRSRRKKHAKASTLPIPNFMEVNVPEKVASSEKEVRYSHLSSQEPLMIKLRRTPVGMQAVSSGVATCSLEEKFYTGRESSSEARNSEEGFPHRMSDFGKSDSAVMSNEDRYSGKSSKNRRRRQLDSAQSLYNYVGDNCRLETEMDAWPNLNNRAPEVDSNGEVYRQEMDDDDNNHSDSFIEKDNGRSWTDSDRDADEDVFGRGSDSGNKKRRGSGDFQPHAEEESTSNRSENHMEEVPSKERVRPMNSLLSESGRAMRSRTRKEEELAYFERSAIVKGGKKKRTQLAQNLWQHNSSERAWTKQGRSGFRVVEDIAVDSDSSPKVERHSERSAMQQHWNQYDEKSEDATFSFGKNPKTSKSTRSRRQVRRREGIAEKEVGMLANNHSVRKVEDARRKRFHTGKGRSQSSFSWLLLMEVEGGTRYIPQFGDDVVYLRQGHQEFLDQKHLDYTGPWKTFKNYLRAVEFCQIVGLHYVMSAKSGDTCCQITMEITDETFQALGKNI